MKGPLRTILDTLIPANGAYGRKKVLLECGHKVWTGDNAMYRARCFRCHSAAGSTVPAGVTGTRSGSGSTSDAKGVSK